MKFINSVTHWDWTLSPANFPVLNPCRVYRLLYTVYIVTVEIHSQVKNFETIDFLILYIIFNSLLLYGYFCLYFIINLLNHF